jgi:hypothetical protein
MHKREFLAAGATVAAAVWPGGAPAAASDLRSPGLLTVSGAITRANRGPLDPAFDRLFAQHGARFDRAWVLDAALLARLPSVAVTPTLEYDGKPHKLAGPLLGSVLKQAGVATDAAMKVTMRGFDGYTASVSLAEARATGFIVASTLDGAPMALGGLGPLWALHDPDRVPALKAKPLKERFAGCPWGLYHVEVLPL